MAPRKYRVCSHDQAFNGYQAYARQEFVGIDNGPPPKKKNRENLTTKNAD